MNRIQRQESMQNAHASMKNYGYFGSHNEWIGIDIEGQTNNEMKIDNDVSPNLFVDGEYNTYYMLTMRNSKKYWYKMNLKFDHISNKVTGIGTDNIGTFTINGIFGKINNLSRIAVTKQYIGKHSVEMRVECNKAVSEFVGAWHLRRNKTICWGACGFALNTKSSETVPQTNDEGMKAAFLQKNDTTIQ